MLKAINQIPTIIAFARFLEICIFKGHQIAKNLESEKMKEIYWNSKRKFIHLLDLLYWDFKEILMETPSEILRLLMKME